MCDAGCHEAGYVVIGIAPWDAFYMKTGINEIKVQEWHAEEIYLQAHSWT